MIHLPFRASLADYQRQAQELHESFRAGDPATVDLIHRHHPRFLRQDIPWLPLSISDDELHSAVFDLEDARLTLARWYNFLDWTALETWVNAVASDANILAFESAVEAVIDGDLESLKSLLAAHPELARARSTRICNFDPPRHRATLLHYVAANGVEGYRQRTPANAVEIARVLLDAGADPNATASMYGGDCHVMGMLVSSDHPRLAGVLGPLTELLIDRGAHIEPISTQKWDSPLNTALVFGGMDAVNVLVRRGAKVDFASAAALGDVDTVKRLLPSATLEERQRAWAFVGLHGQVETARLLADAGEDLDRFNPENMHAHGTAMHHAASGGHLALVRFLVERGARVDIKDKIWDGTPLGWANHCNQPEVAEYLRSQAASN